MDDGEVEPSDHTFLQNPSTSNSNNNTPINDTSNTLLGGGSASVESFFDEFLKQTRTCTHTHTCNPPGPDAAHTHTCYHTHTQVFSSEEDTKTRCETSSVKSKRPLGNREAVRKYREKKKAHTAYLEEEVKNLRMVNEQLIRKLQGQAALEAEIVRLRAVLIGLRGKIDTELGGYMMQNHCSSTNADISSFKDGEYGIQNSDSKAIRFQYQTQMPCFLLQGSQAMNTGDGQRGDEAVLSWQESCQPASVDCHLSGNGIGGGGSDHPFEDVEALDSAKNQCQ